MFRSTTGKVAALLDEHHAMMAAKHGRFGAPIEEQLAYARELSAPVLVKHREPGTAVQHSGDGTRVGAGEFRRQAGCAPAPGRRRALVGEPGRQPATRDHGSTVRLRLPTPHHRSGCILKAGSDAQPLVEGLIVW